MKTILLLAVMAVSALADEPVKIEKLILKNKKEYEGVTITQKRPDGISILHASGTARIKFEDLPDDVAVKLGGFDPTTATKFRDESEKKLAANEAEIDKGIAQNQAVAGCNMEKNLDYFKEKYGKPISGSESVWTFQKDHVFIMVTFWKGLSCQITYSKMLVNEFGQTEEFTENEFEAIGKSNASGGDWEDSGKTTFTRSFTSKDKKLQIYFDTRSNTITVSTVAFLRLADQADKERVKGL